MVELVTRRNSRSHALQPYLEETESFRSAIYSMITDTSIYHIPAPEDSLLFNDYVTSLIGISAGVTPVDEQLNATLRSLRHLDQRVSLIRQVMLSNLNICAQ